MQHKGNQNELYKLNIIALPRRWVGLAQQVHLFHLREFMAHAETESSDHVAVA